MSTKETVLNVTSGIAAACAVVVTSVVVYRQFRPQPAAVATTPSPRYQNRPIQDWQQQVALGRRMGPASAPLTIVYYGDFECPACRGLTNVLAEFRTAHPADLSVVFRHYPLPYHRFASPSARAAECAADQGQFEPMYLALFASQDSLGLVPFHELARRASVSDLGLFDRCLSSAAPVPRVERDRKAAIDTKLPGTPGVIANGLLIVDKMISVSDLEQMVAESRRSKQ